MAIFDSAMQQDGFQQGGVVEAYQHVFVFQSGQGVHDFGHYRQNFGIGHKVTCNKPEYSWCISEVPQALLLTVRASIDEELLTGNWGDDVEGALVQLSRMESEYLLLTVHPLYGVPSQIGHAVPSHVSCKRHSVPKQNFLTLSHTPKKNENRHKKT